MRHLNLNYTCHWGCFCTVCTNFGSSIKGGPYHNRTKKTEGNLFENKEDGCYAPILYDTDKNELIVTPIYYYIGHFSKFVERGAVRIATTKHSRDLYTCAFVNPDGKKVCTIINTSDKEQYATLRY